MERLFGAKPNPLHRGQVGIGTIRKQLAQRGAVRNVTDADRDARKMLEGAPKRQQVGNSCVGEATAQCLGALDYVRDGTRDHYSPLSLYYYARVEEAKMDLVDPDFTVDDGTYPFAALLALKRHGICHESAWPTEYAHLQSPPGWGGVKQSDAHKTTYFYSIDEVDDEKVRMIRSAILSDCPVSFSMPVVSDFLTWKGEVYREISGGIVGYHRLPILGWTASGCAIVRSSWADHGDEDQNVYFAPELLASSLITDVEVFFDGVTQ